MKKIDVILLLLILFFAFLLGSRMILAGDFFYLFDQARDYLIVKNVIQTHSPILIGTHSGLGGFFHGPLWIYILIPVYLLGHGNPLVFAYFYIVLELITVAAAFLIGAKLYGRRGGLLISALVALSPVVWRTVPNTIGVNMMPLVFAGLFYFLIKFLRGDKNVFIYASFFTGLSLQFETALPLVLIPAVAIVFILNRTALKDLKVIGLSTLAFLLSISSFIFFDLRHKFLMSKAMLGAFSGGPKQKGYLAISERISAHLESLLSAYKSLLFTENSVLLSLFTAILIMAVVMIFKNNKYKYRKEFFFLLLFPELIFGIFILYPYKILPEYVFGLVIPVVITLYLAINIIWGKLLGKVLVLLFFGVTGIYLLNHISSQFIQKYQPSNSSGSYINQKNIAEWIIKDAGFEKSGYLVYTPETYTHGMDYLVSYYIDKNPKTDIKNIKSKNTYLVLYPHLENDRKAYEFWKKNVIRTKGRVVSSKIFRGGITVEKLSIADGEPAVDPNYYQGLLFR